MSCPYKNRRKPRNGRRRNPSKLRVNNAAPLHGYGFGGEARDFFGGLAAGFSVGGKNVGYGIKFCAGGAGEDGFDYPGDGEEGEAMVEEGGYGYFIGGVEGAG